MLRWLSDVLRGGGGIEPAALDGRSSSTGDSVKLSSKEGVDEHVSPLGATLPNRNGGSCVSALDGRWGMQLAEYPFVRDSAGRVTGLRRLGKGDVSTRWHRGARHDLLGDGQEAGEGRGQAVGLQQVW